MPALDLGAFPAATARRALLTAQGLSGAPPRKATRESALAAIRRMHSLQIDTISVVARSPYLVLWSRIGDYDPALLDGMLTSRHIFEYWSHAACFLHAEDLPYYRRIMREDPGRKAQRQAWVDSHPAAVANVLARLRDGGPVRSADFERPEGRKGGGWWDWKEEKIALEILFMRGEITISRRDRFQRIYDLPERVFPGWHEIPLPSLEEARRQLILRAVRAMGVARPEWVNTYLQSLWIGVVATRREMAAMAADGMLATCSIEGWNGPAYAAPDAAALLEASASARRTRRRTSFLSPFDPVTWDRARALDLFGFDYRIECYTPAPKRQYGYFTLPILHGDALVGRLDPKAHRKLGIFEVKSIHLEPGVAVTAELVDGLRETLHRMAAWHATPEIVVRESNPPALASLLRD